MAKKNKDQLNAVPEAAAPAQTPEAMPQPVADAFEPVEAPPKENRVADSIKQEAQVYMDNKSGKDKVQNPDKPVGVFSWFGMVLLMTIPVVGIVMVFRWAFSKKVNVNKKNFAVATLILWGILLVVGVILLILFPHIYDPIINALVVLFTVG